MRERQVEEEVEEEEEWEEEEGVVTKSNKQCPQQLCKTHCLLSDKPCKGHLKKRRIQKSKKDLAADMED